MKKILLIGILSFQAFSNDRLLESGQSYICKLGRLVNIKKNNSESLETVKMKLYKQVNLLNGLTTKTHKFTVEGGSYLLESEEGERKLYFRRPETLVIAIDDNFTESGMVARYSLYHHKAKAPNESGSRRITENHFLFSAGSIGLKCDLIDDE